MAIAQLFINHLVELLKTGDEADHYYCARALGNIDAPQALSHLNGALLDEDEDVVMAAAEALSHIGNIQSIPALKQVASDHPDGDVRVAATEVIGTLAKQYPAARNYLFPLADGSLEDNGHHDGWNDNWDIQRAPVIALGDCNDRDAVPSLIKALESEDGQDIETEIMKALAQCGEAGEQALIQQLNNHSDSPFQSRKACRAAQALGLGSGNNSAVALFKVLNHKNPDIRLASITSLGKRQQREYIIDIIQRLDDPSAELRKAALEAAWSISKSLSGNDRFRLQPRHILPLINHQDTEIRISALQFMALLSTSELNDNIESLSHELNRCLTEPNPDVVSAALSLSKKLTAYDHHSVVCQQLEKNDLPVRTLTFLIRHLGTQIKTEDDFQLLSGFSEHENPLVRQSVFESLADISANLKHPFQQQAFLCFENELLPSDDTTKHSEDNAAAEHQSITENQSIESENNRIPMMSLDTREGKKSSTGALENSSEKFEQVLDALNPDYAQSVTRAGQSTLEAITLDNIAASAELHDSQPEDHQQFLQEMLDSVEDDDSEFANLASTNIAQSNHLLTVDAGKGPGKKRAKIARLPNTSNTILAIRALGNCPHPQAINLLLIALTNAPVEASPEVVNALTRLSQNNLSDNTTTTTSTTSDLQDELDNAFGPIATALLAGDPELRLASARLLPLTSNSL